MKNPTPKRKIASKMLIKGEKATPFNSLSWNKRASIRKYKELHKKEIKLEKKSKPKVKFISKRSLKNAKRT